MASRAAKKNEKTSKPNETKLPRVDAAGGVGNKSAPISSNANAKAKNTSAATPSKSSAASKIPTSSSTVGKLPAIKSSPTKAGGGTPSKSSPSKTTEVTLKGVGEVSGKGVENPSANDAATELATKDPAAVETIALSEALSATTAAGTASTADASPIDGLAPQPHPVPTVEPAAEAAAEPVVEEVINNNGKVKLIYEQYDEEFSIVNGTTTHENIDEVYCLSFVMPNCLIHLSKMNPQEKRAAEAEGNIDLFVEENPRGTYHGLRDEEVYYVYVEQEAAQLARDQERMRRIAAGMEGAIQKDENGKPVPGDDGRMGMESCSCLYGNPCVDEYGCKDWNNRMAVAKKNGWKGF